MSNKRVTCRSCLGWGMTERATAKTKLMMSTDLPVFCVECVSYWERAGESYKCLSCLEVMPTRVDDSFPGCEPVTRIDWVHRPDCEALTSVCPTCGVRNRSAGMQRCTVCAKPVSKFLAESWKDDKESFPRKERSGGRHIKAFDELSAGAENALRNGEG